GLLYRRGYFRQTIDADGHQEHAYPEIDLSMLPLARAAGTNGEQLVVSIPLGDRRVSAAVWVAQIGRVPVILLDTDIPANSEADRPITHILYVRGREMRLHQEMVLGVGGIRALRALGVNPSVYHLNEGHSALNLVERTREYVAAGETLENALDHVKRHTVFTIHTPVSAGNEKFGVDLVRRVVGPLCDGTGEADTGGVPLQNILELAVGAEEDRGTFDMTALSLRLSVGANAVSKLHAETANATWSPVITNKILGITNGVHMPTWAGRETRAVYEQFLNADLDRLDTDGPEAAGFWERLGSVDSRAWWDAHTRQKVALGEFLRDSIRRQLGRHGESPDALREADRFFDPNVLTIGFARRFATYKRANLLFTDLERLTRIVSNSDRPVQIVFAGKAHPADRAGQEVIRDIWAKSRADAFRGRIFVMEDYDMRTARYLVAGCDVWLNTPRRPLEASGTSGMKASANGAVNVSILDGWWDEGYTGANGFAIGDTSMNPVEEVQDAADAESLYRILENEVVPRYYDRGSDGLPAAWLDLARASIGSTLWRFSTTRMLHEYCEKLYLPAAAPQSGSHR
ncbi:MAG: alpha-glucan family phosphorylase, partial [bacterium]|nr:alpha-glucan family phosphorylase [Candidatus Aquidulcis frankliniae]